MLTYEFSGAQVGNVASMQLGGFLMRYTDSWTSVFYAFGIFGMLWLVLWFVLIYNHPNRHPFISNKEKTYLNRAINVVDRDDVSIISIIIQFIKNIYDIEHCNNFYFLGEINDSLETNCNISTSVGFNYCTNRS